MTRELVLIDRSHSKVEKVLRLADTLGISPFSIKSCLFLDHSYTALYIIFLKALTNCSKMIFLKYFIGISLTHPSCLLPSIQ